MNYFLAKEIFQVSWSYNIEKRIWICIGKCFGETDPGFGIPFKLKGQETAILFFYYYL